MGYRKYLCFRKSFKTVIRKKSIKRYDGYIEALLHLIGYIKIKNIGIEIIFFRKDYLRNLKKNKKYFILIIIF